MTRGSQVKHEKRNSSELYPTTPGACMVIGQWLATNHPERYAWGRFLDPTAGFGTLLEWTGIDHERRIALELRPPLPQKPGIKPGLLCFWRVSRVPGARQAHGPGLRRVRRCHPPRRTAPLAALCGALPVSCERGATRSR